MTILDSNRITDREISADLCIVGAGPAGIILAQRLADSGLNIVIADSGGKRGSTSPDNLNVMIAESNFTYRNGISKRARQIGGTASLWAGRLVPFRFDPVFDAEWGPFPDLLRPYYKDAFRQFNLNPAIHDKSDCHHTELNGYWAMKTQRFNAATLKKKGRNCRILTHLTFTGQAEFHGPVISSLTFRNRNLQEIKIRASRFVFAMGGIENSRMLLVMGDQIEKRMGSSFRNVGKYIMDHPRVSHGKITRIGKSAKISRYQMKSVEYGIQKTGIRNDALNTRVYCNLFGSPGKITRRVLRFPNSSFQRSSGRLLVKETGLLRTLAHESKRLPLLNRPGLIKQHISGFVSNQLYEKYTVMTYCEQQPVRQNRIVLDSATDRNNVKIPRVINNLQDDELKEVKLFYGKLAEHFKTLECSFTYNEQYIEDPAHFTDSSHIIGGTRFSVNAEKSVVDDSFRVIGIPNFFIAGSSVFPTGGVENPTHLIAVISMYLADKLKG